MSHQAGRSPITWPMESLSIIFQAFLPSSLPVTPPGLGLNSDFAQACPPMVPGSFPQESGSNSTRATPLPAHILLSKDKLRNVCRWAVSGD